MWKYSMCLLFLCPKDNNKYQYTKGDQGLGKPNKIYVYDLLKADNDNWLPKQFKHRKGGQIRKKYYDHAKENVAFERCVDVVTSLTAVFRLYESYCKKMMQHDIIGLTETA